MKHPTVPAGFLLCAIALAGALILAGCTATAPSPSQATQAPPVAVTTAPALPSYMVHVEGRDRGVILLVGRSTCPWCMKTKELLANLSVGYYWIDLETLNEAETAQVISAISVCGQTNSVPILIVNGNRCIVGYQEDQIREAVG